MEEVKEGMRRTMAMLAPTSHQMDATTKKQAQAMHLKYAEAYTPTHIQSPRHVV